MAREEITPVIIEAEAGILARMLMLRDSTFLSVVVCTHTKTK